MPKISSELVRHREFQTFRRTLDVLSCINDLGAPTTNEVFERMLKDIGTKYCRRTIMRDLQMLRAIGFIETVKFRSFKIRGPVYRHHAKAKMVYSQ